jgi:hypothetical protein
MPEIGNGISKGKLCKIRHKMLLDVLLGRYMGNQFNRMMKGYISGHRTGGQFGGLKSAVFLHINHISCFRLKVMVYSQLSCFLYTATRSNSLPNTRSNLSP